MSNLLSGIKYEYEEKRVVAPIRLGGIPQSFARQLLLIGDAAGHVDPLTGEGIHTAMIAGKIAAHVVDEMNKKTNFSLAACKAYGNHHVDLACLISLSYVVPLCRVTLL
jgi:flavin-dependent dehydrogenase